MNELTIEQILQVEASDRKHIRAKKIYIDMINNLHAGIVLSEIVYWHLPGKNGKQRLRQITGQENRWLACRRQSWWDRSRLTPREFDRALDKLVKAGLVIRDHFDYKGQNVLHVRINWPTFEKNYNELLSKKPTKPGRHKTALPGLVPVWDILLKLLREEVLPNGDTGGVLPNGDTPSPNGNTDLPDGETDLPNGDTYTTIYTEIDTTKQNDSPAEAKTGFVGQDEKPVDPIAKFFEGLEILNKPHAEATEQERLDLAITDFFSGEYPPPKKGWSHLHMLGNFFTGKMQPKPNRKDQGAYFENQFSEAPFDPEEIVGMILWWLDENEDALSLTKPSTIAEKAGLFRISSSYQDYVRDGGERLQMLVDDFKADPEPNDEPEYVSEEEANAFVAGLHADFAGASS